MGASPTMPKSINNSVMVGVRQQRMPSQCFLQVGLTFTHFSRATTSIKGLPVRQEHFTGLEILIPNMSTWSELWKASQSLPAADRSEQGVLSWGSGWSQPKPGPWTHFSGWLSPDSPGSFLPADCWPGQGPNSFPIHSATSGRTFCLLRRDTKWNSE